MEGLKKLICVRNQAAGVAYSVRVFDFSQADGAEGRREGSPHLITSLVVVRSGAATH